MLQAGSDRSTLADIAVAGTLKESARTRRSDASASEGGASADVVFARDVPFQRRTPRHSIIVVLPEDHVVSPDRLEGLRQGLDQDVDVLVACAGQPTNLNALQKSVRDAQFLLAPAGTSTETLRELAIKQATGDIIRLLSGARANVPEDAETELSMTS